MSASLLLLLACTDVQATKFDARRLVASPTAVDFGTVEVGSVHEQVVTLSSEAAGDVTVDGWALSFGVDVTVTGPALPLVLERDATAELVLRWTPTTAPVILRDMLTVSSDDVNDATAEVALSGRVPDTDTGTGTDTGTVTDTATDTATDTGTTTATGTVTDTNTGTATSTGAATACDGVYDWSGTPYSCVVPAGVTTLHVRAWGAGGGGGAYRGEQTKGGGGGYAMRDVPVTPGETVWFRPGQGGIAPGGGGGASWVSRENGDVLLVAGGGGGGASDGGSATPANTAGNGGAGGGTSGQAGDGQDYASFGSAAGGAGGTDVAGGAGGASAPGPNQTGCAGLAGSAGTGGLPGIGVDGTCATGLAALWDSAGGGWTNANGDAGGGGAGWFGGGGGGSVYTYVGGGGGGGSGYAPGGTLEAGASSTPGNAADPDRGAAGLGGEAATSGQPTPRDGSHGRIVVGY
ncbi:MAG: hypothetical protein RLZZ299_2297 [Pseudomonadota bacterium]